jgi:hypothetical protein
VVEDVGGGLWPLRLLQGAIQGEASGDTWVIAKRRETRAGALPGRMKAPAMLPRCVGPTFGLRAKFVLKLKLAPRVRSCPALQTRMHAHACTPCIHACTKGRKHVAILCHVNMHARAERA